MAADALRFIDGLRVMGLGRRIYVTDGDKTGVLRRTTQLSRQVGLSPVSATVTASAFTRA